MSPLTILIIILHGVGPAYSQTISLSINETQAINYDKAFKKAQEAGIKTTSLTLHWKDIEKQPGQYENVFVDIASQFYKNNSTSLVLTICPVNMYENCLPDHLAGKRFDDPLVISSFEKMMAWLMARMSGTKIECLVVGNEVDTYFGNSAEQWSQYETFLSSYQAVLQRQGRDVPLGTTVTFGNLLENQHCSHVQNLLKNVMFTYYPLLPNFEVRSPNVVASDFEKVCKKFGRRNLYVTEAGYPTSAKIKGSEANQASFVQNVVSEAAKRKAQIKLVEFSWMNDFGTQEVSKIAAPFNIQSSSFREYLGTIGLNRADGSAKPAWLELKRLSLPKNLP